MKISLLHRAIAAILVPALMFTSPQLLVATTAAANELSIDAAPIPGTLIPAVAAVAPGNRNVLPPPAGNAALPRFSDPPTTEELKRARVFEEFLLPMGAKPTTEENAALARALLTHLARTETDDFSALETFLNASKGSAWEASLLVNLGLLYRLNGYWSKALDAWERTTLSEHDYTYDAAGQIRTWEQYWSGLSEARKWTFGYDATDQLRTAVQRGAVTNGVLRDQAWRYTMSGNPQTAQDGNSVMSYQSNSLNQTVSRTGGGLMRFAGSVSEAATVTVGGAPATVNSDNTFEGFAQVSSDATTRVYLTATDASANAVTRYVDVPASSAPAKVFMYDANGNLRSSGPAGGASDTTYDWDAENRLIKVTQGTAVTEWQYDAENRRVVEKLNGAVVKRFIWSGYELCETRDAGNAVITRFYTQGEQQTVSGAPPTTSNFVYGRDHLGSVRELIDSARTIRARYDYDCFGRRTKLTGDADCDAGFTGHLTHAATQLILAPLRVYDPELSRWLCRDPIEELGGLNLYEYAQSNPVRYTDPLGLKTPAECKEEFDRMFASISRDAVSNMGPYAMGFGLDTVANGALAGLSGWVAKSAGGAVARTPVGVLAGAVAELINLGVFTYGVNMEFDAGAARRRVARQMFDKCMNCAVD